jgi:signal transduction histidine kinase/CheY-like chemotaxis protein
MQRFAGKHFYRMIVVVWLTFSVGSVVLAAVSWWNLSRLLDHGRKLTAVRDTMDGLFDSLLNTETATRGYVITGNTNYLEPFYDSTNRIPSQFADLVALVGDDPAFIQTVTSLRGQADLCLNWEQQVITARDHSFGRATDLFDGGQGKQIMDDIRGRMNQLDQARNNELLELRGHLQRQVFQANLTSMVAGGAGVVAGLIAFWLSQISLRQQKRERKLVEAKLHAERSNQEKSAFLANMSHEIRTPMNAILGFSELLQEELCEPRQRQYLQSVRSSANSLLLLINDILDMSKIEAGVMQLNPEPTDLREICDFIYALFSEPATKKGLKLNCRVAVNFPHAVLLDRIRLRQVLVNLVGNAVKFTDQGNVAVNVLWEKEQTSSYITLVIEVLDTGVGIPPDKLHKIFKPFEQAGVHQKMEKQGTGLGLTIVRRLTEIMGGGVTAASVVGQGSAFHLRFPKVPISARLPESEKSSPVLDLDFNSLRPATLLVVDDNETNCRLIEGMFAGSHHRLIFGTSGREAVSKARELKPDVLLLDVRMPGMSGYEALDEIRKIPGLEFLPVIAVTASNLAHEEKNLKERFSGYVRKPFSKRELFEELADFLPPDSRRVGETETGETSARSAVPALEPVPKELITQLRQLLVEPWPSIRDSVAVNESRTFAEGLEGLGKRWRCQPLVEYAQILLRNAENYAAAELETHLMQFGALVEELAKNVKE